MSNLAIPFESVGFPPGTVASAPPELSVSWDDILWAAVTVGRPNRQYVFRHGDASRYEALFRWSLVRMALEQSGPLGRRLRRTEAARTLDPTEKGAVNYFLGMIFCKLFASKLLSTPWLLHLDVFRPQLNPVLAGRSRPDLVGKVAGANVWHAFECKGRISPPDTGAKSKAKQQALRLQSISGTACTLHVGAITYFKGDSLRFYWCDPEPDRGKSVNAEIEERHWGYYFSPLAELVVNLPYVADHAMDEGAELEEQDLKVKIHPAVGRHVRDRQWLHALHAAEEATADIAKSGYQPDGMRVVAGDSWKKPFDEGRFSKEQ